MSEQGYIKLYRSIMSNGIYDAREPFCKRAAWIDILLNVNHTEAEVVIKLKPLTVKPGESLNSLDTWAARWRWSKSATRRFLKMLENLGQIELKSETVTTRLTVCKWASYQGDWNTDETQAKRKRNASETQAAPNKNEKNKKKNKNEEKPLGGVNFEKLQKHVGPVCAKLLIEGSVGRRFEGAASKRVLFLKWLNYLQAQGSEVRTTQQLAQLLELFDGHPRS
jgi:hypothetical protein